MAWLNLNILNNTALFKNISNTTNVWMSHGDKVTQIPAEFMSIANTDNSPYAAIQHTNKNIYGLQFHPEVIHSVDGEKILNNFLFEYMSM